jgi:hypothetical protein
MTGTTAAIGTIGTTAAIETIAASAELAGID